MERTYCPKCNKKLKFASQLSGEFVDCPKCQERIQLPAVVQSTAMRKEDIQEPQSSLDGQLAYEIPKVSQGYSALLPLLP